MDWKQALAVLGNHLSRNAAQYTFIGTLVASAIVRHMPEQIPTSFQALYAWFRSSAQELANQKRGMTEPAAAPTLPPAAPTEGVIG